MILICITCSKIFQRSWGVKPGQNTFCSRSCSARYTNKTSPKRKPEGNCRVCYTVISSSKTYCSETCRNKIKIAQQRTRREIARANGEAIRSWRQRTKQKALDYKGGKCTICGYDRCVRALQFHHLNPKEKDFSISGKSKSWETIQKELDKCVLLCSNCHAEVHAGYISL